MISAWCAFGLGFALAGTLSVACSSGPVPPRGDAPADGGVDADDTNGSIAFRLTLPGGEHIATVSYSLTNGAFTMAGSAPVDAITPTFVIAGVPAGDGYSISLTATSGDGTVSCAGSYGTGISDAGQNNGAPFSVPQRKSANVSVQLICVRKGP
jgi:hypothetical protein